MKKKKVCIVVTSLGRGGAERSSALLSIMLDNLGYNVHIVSVLNDIEYEYKGTLLNLGEFKDQEDTFIGRLKRYIIFKNYLKSQKFDLIIDNRTRPKIIKEFLINRLLFKNYNVVYVARSRKIELYFTKSIYWAKKIFKNAFAYVSVSEDITNVLKNDLKFTNVKTINNPVEIERNNKKAQDEIEYKMDYILFYGRLDDKVKNISFLIEAFKASDLPDHNIKLLVLGDGEDLIKLKKKAENSPIEFIPFTNNPFPYIKNAKYCCLTSKFEGFPRAVIESLSIGTPIVSVDCSGSKEIIINEYNGLLVENNNLSEFTKAMNRLIFDEDLYSNCKRNAIESVKHLSMEEIGKQWDSLINNTNGNYNN